MAAPSPGTAQQLQDVGTVGRVLDMTPRAVQQLASRGILPRARHGQYDLLECVRRYVRHLREQAAGRASADGKHDLVAERARLAREQADSAAFKNATSRGELVPAADIEHAQTALHSAIQRRLLTLPSDVAPLVAVENDARECEAIIRSKLDEALSALADAEVLTSEDRSAGEAPGD